MPRPQKKSRSTVRWVGSVALLTVFGLVVSQLVFGSPADAAWTGPWHHGRHHGWFHRPAPVKHRPPTARPTARPSASPTGPVVRPTGSITTRPVGVPTSSPTAIGSSAPPPTTVATTPPVAVPSPSVPSPTVPGPSVPGPATTTAPSAADPVTFSAAVPAVPSIVSAARAGSLRQDARVGGRDNGTSVGYNGRSYWIFDDTTLKDPWGFLSNSAAVTTDLNAADGIDLQAGTAFSTAAATPSTLIPHTAAETAFEKAHNKAATGCTSATDQYCGASFGFWPGNVVADPARDRLLVYFGKLCRGGASGTPCSGPLGRGLGTGIAAINLGSQTVTRLSATGHTAVNSVEGSDPTMLWGPGEGAYSGSNVVDGTLYTFGGCDYWSCRTAEVPLADVLDRTAYRYWNGSNWGTDVAAGVKTGPTPGSAGHTTFYDPALRSWVNMWMPYGTSSIMYQVAGRPQGPWSAGRTALVAPKGNGTTYALFAHPEYAEKNGAVQYVTWFDAQSGDQELARIEFSTP